MTPTELADLLRAMKESGALQVHLECEGTKLTAVFPAGVPEMPADFGAPEPGGWKSRTGDLDAPLEPEL